VGSVTLNSGKENGVYFNSLIILYSTHIVLFFALSFIDLVKRYLASNKKEKKTMFYMVLGSILSASLSGVSNLILPNIGIFSLNWFGQVVSLFLVFSTGYAIIRYRLFGSKGVTFVMFISFFLTTIILRGVFSSSIIDLTFNAFLFITSSVLGYQIINNFVLQTEQKELLANLNKQLTSQNKKIEIQKSSLVELMKVKDETLHIVNHQLNTPVSVIRASVQAFQDKIWGEEKFFGVVNTELKRISETVGQFLAAKKAEDEHMKLVKTKSDLGTLVRSLIDEKRLLKKVRDDNIEIKFVESEKTLPVVCDVGKITEVVSNLLDNAINYSNKNILVKLSNEKKGILLEVKDSGIGIPPNSLDKLFQRFSRLENAKKSRPDGTGLGLYVCKQIVEAHGGRIWAESEGMGKGSSFLVELPV
jgi:signal transduction histidine kinase